MQWTWVLHSSLFSSFKIDSRRRKNPENSEWTRRKVDVGRNIALYIGCKERKVARERERAKEGDREKERKTQREIGREGESQREIA